MEGRNKGEKRRNGSKRKKQDIGKTWKGKREEKRMSARELESGYR